MTRLRTVSLVAACEAPPPEVRLPEAGSLQTTLFLTVMTGSSEGGQHGNRSVVTDQIYVTPVSPDCTAYVGSYMTGIPCMTLWGLDH